MSVDISWPTDLPLDAEYSSYQEAAESNLVSFQPEVGPPKTRRRNSLATYLVSFVTIMNGTEVEALMDYFRDTLEDGAQLFNRLHPRTQTIEVFEFTQPPQLVYRNFDAWGVTLNLRWYPE